MRTHPTRRSLSPASLLAVALACSATTAHAEAPETLETARRLFHEATELEEAHVWDGAAAKLREALAIKDTPGLRFHLAHCEEQSGQLLAADQDYLRATALIRAGASAPDVENLLPDALAAVERRLPTLQIVLSPDSNGAVVELDGITLAPFTSEAQPLDPKPHHVVVTLPSGRRTEQTLTLVEGERRVLSLAAPPLGEAPARALGSGQFSREFAASSAGRASSARSYVLVGESALVLAGLGLGVGFALARSSATDRASAAQRSIADAAMGNHAACSSPSGALSASCQDFSDALEARDRDGTWEVVGFAAAGVSAGALIASALLWPKHSRPEHGYGYQPWLGRHAVGVMGRF